MNCTAHTKLNLSQKNLFDIRCYIYRLVLVTCVLVRLIAPLATDWLPWQQGKIFHCLQKWIFRVKVDSPCEFAAGLGSFVPTLFWCSTHQVFTSGWNFSERQYFGCYGNHCLNNIFRFLLKMCNIEWASSREWFAVDYILLFWYMLNMMYLKDFTQIFQNLIQ